MKPFLISSVIFFSLITSVFSQKSALDDGWKAFAQNDFDKAKTKFTKATSNEQTKAKANLALSIVYHTENKPELSFKYFEEYYKNPTNPNNELYALWDTESVSNGKGKLSEDRFDFIEDLEFEGKDGMFEAIKKDFLRSHFLYSNKIKKSKKFKNTQGVITNWSAIGTFSNISASGFNKTHGILESPDNSKKFKNKNGGEIKWREVEHLPISNWLSFSNYFINGNSTLYAQTFCKSESAQKVQIRLGFRGSFRLWVNDELIFEQEEEQNTEIDAYIASIQLKSGYNRILVQSGCSEYSSSAIFVRLTDKNGKSLENISFDANYQDYSKATNTSPKTIEIPTETYYKQQIKDNPEKILNYILLYYTFDKNGKTQDKLSLVKKAKEKFPKSILIKSFLIESYGEVENETDMSIELESIKEIAPESYISLVLFYNEEIDKEEYDEAEKLLNKMIEIYGSDELTTTYQIGLASSREQNEELISLIKDAYEKYPENTEFVSLRHTVYSKVEKNKGKAAKIIKKYLKKNLNVGFYDKLANYYFESADVNRGISIYSDLAKSFPENASYKYTLGRIYFSMQNYRVAQEYFHQCLELAPYAYGYYSKLASSYEEQGLEEEAIKYYEKVIEYGRYDFEAREKIRVLNGEDKLFDQFPEVKSPEDLLKNSPTAKDLPEDNSVILLDETHTIVHKDGASEARSYFMVKVLNTAGVDSWKEYSVSRGGNLNIEEAKVYKADGTKVEGDINYSYVVFTGLEEGDAIYIEYKREKVNFGKLAKHFWDNHYFEYFIPTKQNNYRLLIHNTKKFKYEVTNGKIEPTIEDKGDYKLYEWKSPETAGVKSESYMPSLIDIVPTLHLSSFKDWSEIVEWYQDLSQTKQKSDVGLKTKVKELFEGKENLTEVEKAKLIYKYITKNIRYSSVSFRQSGLIPQKASKVISSKLGDCKDVSTLFVSMCKEVGLNASLVLVNTRNNGDNDVYLPSIDFNHCIAKINLENKEYYIELTSDLIPFSTHSSTLRYATVLDIEDNSKNIHKLDVDTRLKNEIKRYATITFSGDNMTVNKKSAKTGYYSGTIRSIYRDIGKEKQWKKMQEAVNGSYVKTKLEDLSFDETLDSNTDEINYNYKYLVKDVFNDVGGILIFKLPWADKAVQAKFLSADQRKLPISIWKYDMADLEYEKITINLPKDKKLVKAKPKDIIIENEFFSYKLTHKNTGGKLIITREFHFKKYQVDTKDYSKFKDAYEKVIKADTRQLAFKE